MHCSSGGIGHLMVRVHNPELVQGANHLERRPFGGLVDFAHHDQDVLDDGGIGVWGCEVPVALMAMDQCSDCH